ncbi:MAG: hypothetical protein IPN19_04815 [Elusimicrobia bacterium]|nr:hypothetical protein [Elusimicrobiota bacterium]
MRLQKYIDIVTLIEEESSTDDSSKTHREELELLIPEFVDELFQQGRISEIENRVSELSRFDMASVKKNIKIIADSGSKPYIFKSTTKQIDPKEIISDVETKIQDIEENARRLGSLEITLRLEMILDSDFNRLVITCEGMEKPLGELENLVFEKLSLLKDDEILLLWGRIKGLFEGDAWTAPLINYDDITPPSFWETKTIEDIRRRCADFIVRRKPFIIRNMTEAGLSYRTGIIGIARALAFRKILVNVSNLDVLVVRSISTLIAITKKFTGLEPSRIARGIGRSPDSLVFSGEYFESAERNTPDRPTIKNLVSAMKKTKNYVETVSLGRGDSNVEENIWRYKLGQEAIAPSSGKMILSGKKNEITLQKEVCKFLLEKGILSFGKSFGRSQIDLYAKERIGEDYVIETKIYTSPPSERMIRSNFAQLLSYMDQESHQQPRGILVLFNCSDCLVTAPRVWLNDRIFVIALNIGKIPPSGRKSWIEIKQGDALGEVLIIKDGSKSNR